jgi:polysaccharide biosynthesis protein VpsQ
MKWRLLTAVWLALICAIIWLAGQRGPSVFAWVYYVPAGDKLGHFLLMGGLAFLLNLSLHCRKVRVFHTSWLLGSVLVLCLAGLEELSQAFLPTRNFDGLDFLADVAGVWLLGRMSTRVLASHSGPLHASHPQCQ